ncbi:hypothetical protein D3C71_1592870 [compost metagenome]
MKVPNIPFLPLEQAGKYVKMSLKDLKEKQSTNIDEETSIKLVKDVADIFVKDFENSSFIKELKKSDIPTDFKDSKHVINLSVTNSNIEDLVTTLLDKTVPNILTLLEKNYSDKFDITKDQYKTAKENLKNKDVKDELLKVLKNDFKLNTLNFTIGLDKSDYISKQAFTLDTEITDDTFGDATMKLNVKYDLKDIGKEQKFEQALPKKSETISIEEMQNSLF